MFINISKCCHAEIKRVRGMAYCSKCLKACGVTKGVVLQDLTELLDELEEKVPEAGKPIMKVVRRFFKSKLRKRG